MTRYIACLTFDFDVMSGWVARGMTTPTPISRGEFGIVGARRIVDLLAKYGIRSTWFVPGVIIETYPEVCRELVVAGHEIGHHGWSHLPPAALTREQEADGLIRGNLAIERLCGRRARGYRSPAWDLSDHTVDLLLEHGFHYDSSLMGADYLPYRARRGDVAKLNEPYRFGEETALIEMPISWSLDDYPHFEFVRASSGVLASMQPPRAVMQSWLDEFRYMKKSVDWGVLTYTMHPYVIGRGQRMLALEELVDSLGKEGALFMTMQDAAQEAEERLS
jgi:peptidoglycan/xylan/chitin deacetylase (PgdA/CDA1 family)